MTRSRTSDFSPLAPARAGPSPDLERVAGLLRLLIEILPCLFEFFLVAKIRGLERQGHLEVSLGRPPPLCIEIRHARLEEQTPLGVDSNLPVVLLAGGCLCLQEPKATRSIFSTHAKMLWIRIAYAH